MKSRDMAGWLKDWGAAITAVAAAVAVFISLGAAYQRIRSEQAAIQTRLDAIEKNLAASAANMQAVTQECVRLSQLDRDAFGDNNLKMLRLGCDRLGR